MVALSMALCYSAPQCFWVVTSYFQSQPGSLAISQLFPKENIGQARLNLCWFNPQIFLDSLLLPHNLAHPDGRNNQPFLDEQLLAALCPRTQQVKLLT